ncbi:preprotein translocase subunit SecE [Arhodomonas aquaeolei]|uniref:preprotein translocase subunit SecE n=1 Tax=Arhodomonas aquaeolei TaxID=2369 RepID=UPI00036978DF|nr:preprotein translocase subunit SecE [Arhodomonas aquaeolei]
MSARAESQSSPLDSLKLAVAIGLFLLGVVAFYWFEAQSVLYRAIGLIAVAAVSIGIAMSTVRGRAAWAFARESRQELRRVVWPTRQETLQTTMIVIAMVLLVAVMLWLLDMFFLWGVESLVRPGG